MQIDDMIRTDAGEADQTVADHYRGKVAELARDVEVCRQALLSVEAIRLCSDKEYRDCVQAAVHKATGALDRIGRG